MGLHQRWKDEGRSGTSPQIKAKAKRIYPYNFFDQKVRLAIDLLCSDLNKSSRYEEKERMTTRFSGDQIHKSNRWIFYLGYSRGYKGVEGGLKASGFNIKSSESKILYLIWAHICFVDEPVKIEKVFYLFRPQLGDLKEDAFLKLCTGFGLSVESPGEMSDLDQKKLKGFQVMKIFKESVSESVDSIPAQNLPNSSEAIFRKGLIQRTLDYPAIEASLIFKIGFLRGHMERFSETNGFPLPERAIPRARQNRWRRNKIVTRLSTFYHARLKSHHLTVKASFSLDLMAIERTLTESDFSKLTMADREQYFDGYSLGSEGFMRCERVTGNGGKSRLVRVTSGMMQLANEKFRSQKHPSKEWKRLDTTSSNNRGSLNNAVFRESKRLNYLLDGMLGRIKFLFGREVIMNPPQADSPDGQSSEDYRATMVEVKHTSERIAL